MMTGQSIEAVCAAAAAAAATWFEKELLRAFARFVLLLINLRAVALAMDAHLLPAPPAASSVGALDPSVKYQADAVVGEGLERRDFIPDAAAFSQETHLACDKQLPLGWMRLTDNHGVSYYVEPSLGTFQYTHPSLNAPPFAPDHTDYVMGHPSHDAPALAWMLYLWVREVKSSHSVIGVLCALSLCGRRVCAPPLDKLFQRRVAFRMWFMISSLLSSLLWQVCTKILVKNPKSTVDEAISGCSTETRCTLLSIFLQMMFVSLPFGILR
jgi:hypothetical protein